MDDMFDRDSGLGSDQSLTAGRSLAQQRHEQIVVEVRARGSMRVTELASLLDVSDMTIRRDLDVLDEAGSLVKVHGGAKVSIHHNNSNGF